MTAAPPESVPEFRGRTAATAVRWSSLSVLGRQGAQIVFALIVARLLGPTGYGVISAATVYVTLTALLLDQGISAALVQRRDLDPSAPGAAATINLLFGAALGVLTLFGAPLIGSFFGSALLATLLPWLAFGLLFKAAAISPRAMLLRRLALKSVAVADIAGAGVGAIAGITAALLGAGPESMVIMTLLGDAITATTLLIANHGPRPNLRLRTFAPLVPFGARVFATNGIAYFSRNTDNVLIGRVLGTTPLAYYSMGYRILVIPVQLIGQSVNRVMYPVFSRNADRREQLADHLVKATELLAIVTIPAMALLAASSTQLVLVVLGAKWLPAAPIMSVLAIAGARETIFYLTPALIRATGRAGLNLRFELLSTAVQVVGIVIGLQFGLLGVAIGYAIAGFLLMPVILILQRRLTGVVIRSQLAALWPPLHASLWASATYLLLSGALRSLPAIVTLGVAGAAALVVLFGVLGLVHRRYAARVLPRIALIAGRRRTGGKAEL